VLDKHSRFVRHLEAIPASEQVHVHVLQHSITISLPDLSGNPPFPTPNQGSLGERREKFMKEEPKFLAWSTILGKSFNPLNVWEEELSCIKIYFILHTYNVHLCIMIHFKV
jgi:hypothetical protein